MRYLRGATIFGVGVRTSNFFIQDCKLSLIHGVVKNGKGDKGEAKILAL